MKGTDKVNPDYVVRPHNIITMGKPQELMNSKWVSRR